MGHKLNIDRVDAAILRMLSAVENPQQSLKMYRSVYDKLSDWWSRHPELSATETHWLHHLREVGVVDLWHDNNHLRNYWRIGEGMRVDAARPPRDMEQLA